MEISKLSGNSIKLKGKNVSLIVNPEKESPDFQGALFLRVGGTNNPHFGEGIAIDGSGEYEIAGVKIKAIQKETDIIFTLDIEGITIIIGSLTALEKMQGKFQDLAIACVSVDTTTDPSFMSGFASNYILYFGEKCEELSQTYLKNEVERSSKLTTTKEKLPQEMQTILLV